MAKIKAVTVHGGHNPSGRIACGASDYIDESREDRIITKKVVRLLKKNGIKAYDCTVNNGTSQRDVLKKICAKCNSKVRDIDISIHFNASDHQRVPDGKTTGTEVWVRDTSAVKGEVARRICNQIAKVGFKNRGVKTTSDLWFLNKTKKPALLIEVCFVSDPDDAILYKKHKDDIAKAIVQAVINYNRVH
ncbi:N-acetylmuramoyl-L-alanine amidase [Eubacterium sp. MSJ-13]|uniref:N-acetylmuramoyl-L-alanine amidase n=1 Tax=Eubacterium sp. MSJ-13 TaxID=2841513 RepID=UPI001C11F6ED|nr:N-acetylmuramoyl-L-alanine amidase [Eubacterium sp. MSJ-13]MBU5478956.1 N-acetylmuramoyl-L-alanine amidase [Eubacterium sp. MSJ-13]